MKKLHLFLLILLLGTSTNVVNAKRAISQITSLDSNEAGWIDAGKYKYQNKKIGAILNLKYSQDGKSIFTFSDDKYFRKWDVESGKVVEENFLNFPIVLSSDFTSDGRFAILANKDSVFKYDIENEKILFNIEINLALNSYEVSQRNIIVLISPLENEIFINKSTKCGSAAGLYNFANDVGISKIYNFNAGSFINTFDSGNVALSFCYSNNQNFFAYSSTYVDVVEGGKTYTKTENFRINAKVNNLLILDGIGNAKKSKLYFTNFNNSNNIITGFKPYTNSILLFDPETGKTIKNVSSLVDTSRNINEQIFKTSIFSNDDNALIFLNNIKNNNNETWTTVNIILYKSLVNLDTLKLPYNESWIMKNSPTNNNIALGSSDGIIRILDSNYINNLVKADVEIDKNSNFKIEILPNPFNNMININFELLSDGKVDIQIINELGQEIKVFELGLLSKGENKFQIDFNGLNLNEGVYFIKMIAGNENISKRIIYQK